MSEKKKYKDAIDHLNNRYRGKSFDDLTLSREEMYKDIELCASMLNGLIGELNRRETVSTVLYKSNVIPKKEGV